MKRIVLIAVMLLAGCIPSAEQEEKLDTLLAEVELLQQGKPAIVNFWASWCSFCKEELPLLEEIHRTGEVAVIGINLQEKDAVVERHWNDGGYTFASIQDPDSLLKKHYKVFTQPTTFFVDGDGEIVHRKDGPLNERQLEKEVEELLGKETKESKDYKESEDSSQPSIQNSPTTSRLTSWYGPNVDHLIPLEEILSGGPRKDGIPSIDHPKFISIKDADYLIETDVGLLVEIKNDVRFYPYRILNWHEIVNDTVGGKPVVITYCPLCATGVVYDRTIPSGVTEFGVSGMLYQSNLLMYDRATDSLWNQVTAQAVVGPLTGEKIELLASDVVTFETLKKEYPRAQVLSTDTGHSRSYDRTPYAGYADDPSVMFPVQKRDDRLFSKELVYGIVINDIPKAYPQNLLEERGSIEDTVGGEPVTITWDSVREKVSVKNERTDIVPIPIFWFSWVAQYPETELYQ